MPEYGSWGGGFGCFGQCPKENVFFEQMSSLMAKDITVQSSPIQWLTPNRLSSLPPLRRRRRRMLFCRTFPLNLFCCQYLLRCQIPSLNRSKESQYIFGDCNKFHFMPNLPVSYSCLLTMLVGILCDVSPICQSLRSAHSMDSTGNGGSRSKVLRNLHVVRHQVPHLSKKSV